MLGEEVRVQGMQPRRHLGARPQGWRGDRGTADPGRTLRWGKWQGSGQESDGSTLPT